LWQKYGDRDFILTDYISNGSIKRWINTLENLFENKCKCLSGKDLFRLERLVNLKIYLTKILESDFNG